jgi:hypothetical protein
MPLAVAVTHDNGEKFDLKSVKDGFVVLKRLSYGQKMSRRSLLSKAKMQTGGSGNRAERRAKANQGFMAELELMNDKVTFFEFANCIIDHNLEYLTDPDDLSSVAKLDFTNPEHVKMLAGNVGEEIDELINDLNNFEEDEETGK